VTSTSLLDHKPSAVTNELHRCVCHLPTLSQPTRQRRPGSVMNLLELIYLVKFCRSICVHTTKHEAQKLCHKIVLRPAARLPITSLTRDVQNPLTLPWHRNISAHFKSGSLCAVPNHTPSHHTLSWKEFEAVWMFSASLAKLFEGWPSRAHFTCTARKP
jgi:hypothetical protein